MRAKTIFAYLGALITALVTTSSAALAQQTAAQAAKPLPVFDIAQSGVQFQSGDTWTQNGQTFRLYGVQSCIRGTIFTNQAGVQTDCGEASLAYFAALIRDAKPRCTAITQVGTPPLIYTVCAAHIGANALDLGTILITQGYAFAAADGNGKPVNFPYSVAEADARASRRGLWAARDLPYPNAILLDALHAKR